MWKRSEEVTSIIVKDSENLWRFICLNKFDFNSLLDRIKMWQFQENIYFRTTGGNWIEWISPVTMGKIAISDNFSDGKVWFHPKVMTRYEDNNYCTKFDTISHGVNYVYPKNVKKAKKFLASGWDKYSLRFNSFSNFLLQWKNKSLEHYQFSSSPEQIPASQIFRDVDRNAPLYLIESSGLDNISVIYDFERISSELEQVSKFITQ